MNIYHAMAAGAVSGACLSFAMCLIKDLTLADTIYRMFIVGLGGAWVGFLLAWLNMILPQADKPSKRHQREHQI